MLSDFLARARALDAADPLAGLRARFALPGRGAGTPGAPPPPPGDGADRVIYLCGNSLGPLAAGVPARVARTVEVEWGHQLAGAWRECGWMDAPGRIGDRIARLIGARPGEVLVADSTTVVLAKLVGAALAARPTRRVIVTTPDNFPSDLYAASGAARLAGAELRVVDGHELEDALGELGDQVALCCMTHVDFRTGALHDLARTTEAAHRHGALMLWDLSHSAGALPVGCRVNGIDLAVGCTYKYLNGGPGSPSFLYVRQELQGELVNPIPGWLGHATPFSFQAEWQEAPGIRRFLTSTPPVLALAALDAALDVFDGVTIEAVREKSRSLGALFAEVVEAADVVGLEIASPRDPEARGAHVALSHRRAPEVVAAAAERGVVGDVRPPDICRFGFPPLSLSFEEVALGATTVADVARSLSGA